MYKAAIFDMDGTILNTLQDLADTVNYSLKAVGMPERSLDEVRRFVGNGIKKLVERAVPAGTDAGKIEKVYAVFKEYYAVHCADHTEPYGGIPEVLKKLRALGVKTAVVSNKADFAVQELSAKYFGGLFDAAVGERAGIRIKPAPDAVNEIMCSFGYKPEECVFIGDSDVDAETAKNAGIDVIGAAWGFRGHDFLEKYGVKVIADSADELFAAICGHKCG